MAFIKDILDSEKQARDIIAKAHEKAKDAIKAVRDKEKESLVKNIESLKQSRSEQISNQKKKLAELYKEKIAEGKKDIDRVRNKAATNHNKAVLEVLNSISS